ncbi:MAG: adenylyltransferase/cytidyltransferase family protein, partial [Candidatus Aenigmatarchaeota archaeon]
MKALFILRAQPFHKGHLYAIKKAAKKFEVIIGIGSS